MKLDRQIVLDRTRAFVRERCDGEPSGHDWWHTDRVCRTALAIGREEDVDLFVVELAALLHDVADWKVHGGDRDVGPAVASSWLRSVDVNEATIAHVCEIVRDVSFKGADVESPMRTLEGAIVQDADRLDAIGAIGIARAFAYGGYRGRALHDPDVAPLLATSAEEYRTSQSTSLNHFSEKLLLLRDRMNTETARQIAADRHRFMERFLEQFRDEWNGRA